MIFHVLVIDIENIYVVDKSKLIELGWANINVVATFLIFSIASAWYLLSTVKNMIPLIIIITLLYVGLVHTGSDGVTGTLIVFSPVMAYFSYRNLRRENKKTFLFILSVVAVCALICAIILVLSIGYAPLVDSIKVSLEDNGRSCLYIEALDLFKQFPLFGVGLGYVNPNVVDVSGLRLYNFHSTFFHSLATMGIFGLLAFSYYVFKRFKILASNKTAFSLFMLIAFLSFECYAMIDTSEFNAIPLMSSVTVMIVIVELLNKKGNELEPLPLSINRKNGYNF
jgi:O-antigen ligase